MIAAMYANTVDPRGQRHQPDDLRAQAGKEANARPIPL